MKLSHWDGEKQRRRAVVVAHALARAFTAMPWIGPLGLIETVTAAELRRRTLARVMRRAA